jgi:hypothetical protein
MNTAHRHNKKETLPSTLKLSLSTGGFFLMPLLCVFAFGNIVARAEEPGGAGATKPLTLIDFASPDAGKQVTATQGIPEKSSVTVDKTGIALNFQAQKPTDGKHPGCHVTPATGKSWDLSAYGHVEAKVTNTSDKKFDVVMHVVGQGDGFWEEKNMEFVGLNPGETKVLKVVFGYQKGFKPGPPLKSSSVTEIYIYVWDKAQARSFRIEELKAAGVAGEEPEEAQNPATATSQKTP